MGCSARRSRDTRACAGAVTRTPRPTETGHARPVTPADTRRGGHVHRPRGPCSEQKGQAASARPSSAGTLRGTPRRLPAGGELASARGRVCLRVCTHVCGLPAPSAADSLVYSSSTLGPRQPPCRPPKPACLFQPLWPPVGRWGEAPLPAPGWALRARGGGGPWAPARRGGAGPERVPVQGRRGPSWRRLFPSGRFAPTGPALGPWVPGSVGPGEQVQASLRPRRLIQAPWGPPQTGPGAGLPPRTRAGGGVSVRTRRHRDTRVHTCTHTCTSDPSASPIHLGI